MEKNNQNNIDKKVQESLNNYEVPFNADHWDLMEQQLKALDKEEATFDETISQRMNAAETPLKPTHWAQMEEELKALDMEEAAFDKALRQRMASTEVPFKAPHWDIMDARLDEEFSWKAKIVRFKVIELALMFLVLFTIVNVLDTEGGDYNTPTSTTQPSSLNKNNETKKEIKTFNNDADWRNRTRIQPKNTPSTNSNNGVPIVSVDVEKGAKNELKVSSSTSVTSINSIVLDNKTEKTLNTVGIISSNIENASQKTGIVENSIKSDAPTDINNKNSVKAVEELPAIALTSLNSEIFNTPQLDKINAALDTKNAIATVEPLSILRPKALSIMGMVSDENLPKLSRKNKWWTFGIFGTSNVDMSTVAYQYKSESGKGRDWSINKGLGISFGRKKGRMEIESGLVFSNKKYNTQLPESVIRGSVFAGNSEVILLPQSVDMNVLQIPVNINTHLTSFGRWELFTSLGGSANLAMKLNADYFTPEQSTTKQLQTQARSGSETDKLPSYDKAFKLPFILDNKNNYYFTAQAGVGLNYTLSSSTAIFAQSNFEKQFGGYGIGTMRDKINTVSIHAGLKMRLDKK